MSNMRMLILVVLSLCSFIADSKNGVARKIEAPKIIQTPIIFDEQREQLSLLYLKERYGIIKNVATIIPKMIVVHYTVIPTFKDSFNAFNPSVFTTGQRPDISAINRLNVSAHYLIDRDGAIHQLLADTTFARHVIGLNYTAIGIENVGDGDKLPLTIFQLRANTELIKYLVSVHNIEYLIGHFEYKDFVAHPLWKEKSTNYRTEKSDPGVVFMKKLRKNLSELSLKGSPLVQN